MITSAGGDPQEADAVDQYGGGAIAAKIRSGQKGGEGEGQSELQSLECCSCHRTSNSLKCMHAVPDAPECRRMSTVLHNATRTL